MTVFTKTTDYVKAVKICKTIRASGHKAKVRKEEKVKGYPIYSVLTSSGLSA